MTVEGYVKRNTSSLEGKTIAITGATGGIGVRLCRRLASLGASLILLDRSKERSEALAESLKSSYGISARHVTVDHESMESVKAATDELIAAEPDVFICNAGAYSIPRRITDSGYDNVFQINFISPYFMIRKLLPVLEKKGGRVVAVGSIAHNYSKTDPDDIDFRTRKRSSDVYGNSKRYLMYALLSLFKERKGVSLAVCHPGITFTNITAHYPKLIFAVIKHPMKVIFMSNDTAALSILRGGCDRTEDFSWYGPRFFNVWGLPSKKPLKTAKPEEIDRIFKTAEDIYGKLSEINP